MQAVYPENTLLSFEKAIALGVDGLELDVNVSRDGELIVMHDLTVDRTTNGTGLIRSLTVSELKALDAGASFDASFAGQQIPTLDEFCQLVRQYPDVLLNVEIKDRTDECVDKTVETLARHGMVGRCVFTCFDAAVLERFHHKHALPTQGFPGFLMQRFVPGLEGTLSCMTAVGIALAHLTPERVADYLEMGILPWGYCPDDEVSAAFCRYCGCRLVTSNNPSPCLRVFRDA